MTYRASEFNPPPVAPQPLQKGPLAALLEWQAMANRAYSSNTLRAQKADGAIFQPFCETRGESFLPADPKTINAFIEERVKAGRKPATIQRYVTTISRAHVAPGFSGHSTRVGAAQDLAELDTDLAAITRAGGWKSPRMPLQCAEKINVARSGMARAAAATGRDDRVSE